MAIHGVDTKCYILALFVRDDGERFLLGSGHYEFKNTQMHFAANAIQNDIVEVQGNDGFLLAGQVRRPGTQSFDGYVGDGTMSKEETESYRRQFFSFFRKNFFYKVIYVFSDGTAIQRKRGFLVDDPTVQELYQIYPEYHVALNFEDVNYYSYSEDDEGHEEYAKEATIDVSSMRATGGLEWDNLGVIWEDTQWGGSTTLLPTTETTLQNSLNVPAKVDDIQIEGDTKQTVYTGKNILPPPTNGTNSSGGLTFTITDNTISASGVVTGTPPAMFPKVAISPTMPSGNFTFSIVEPNNYRIGIVLVDDNNTNHSTDELSITPGQTSVAINTTYNITGYRLSLRGLSINDSVDFSMTNKFQLETGTVATSYEPYTGRTPAPSPSYPQDIKVATGTQTITLNDDDSNTHTYTINLGSTELCKISNYQDYIYKSGSDWYIHKETGKVIFTGATTESWALSGQPANYLFNTPLSLSLTGASAPLASNNFMWNNSASASQQNAIYVNSGGRIVFVNPTSGGATVASSVNEWRTWLNSHNTAVYYVLATPTDTKITDASLVTQLNALGTMRLFIGENNLTVQATGTNLPAPISFKYYTSVNITGAEWEEGGSGGATVVEVDSITNIYPIWKVTGPAANPELSVITTNTTIQYSGTITSTQTLEVDMFNKTAKLNGASVIGNISGDWVNFSPGTNRVLYTADNADALPSTIEWQEVVG